jgi:hypothetical protein
LLAPCEKDLEKKQNRTAMQNRGFSKHIKVLLFLIVDPPRTGLPQSIKVFAEGKIKNDLCFMHSSDFS